MIHGLGLAALILPAATALASTPHLVRDVNSTIIAVDASPSDFLDQGNWSFLVASDGVHGTEPWATDGTLAGTLRLSAVNPLPIGITGYQTVRAGALTYFFTNGVNSGSALWCSDGTPAGTRLVIDVSSSGVNPSLVGALGDKLIFSLFQSNAGRELWRSDGTAAGTARIKDVNGANNSAVSPIIANGKIYFLADNNDTIFEPWVSDGTEAGTHRVAQIPGAVADVNWPTLTRAGNYLLLDVKTSATGKELWRIDLNTDAVAQVADIAPGNTSSIVYPQFGNLGAVALFVASDTGGNTPALWRTDGTQAGTFFVANVNPIASSPMYVGPTSASRLVFVTDPGLGNAEVWSTDGSAATVLTTSHSVVLGVVGGEVYFITNPGGGAPELWRTDGTSAGTRKLTAFLAGSSDYFDVAGSGSQLYVRTRRAGAFNVYRYEKSTDQATLLRSYSLPLNQSAGPNVFAFAQGRLYFDSVHPVTGHELWTSDGTPAGTNLVRNIAPETRTQSSAPTHLFAFKGRLYFTADDGVSGRELWRSDGTPGGTQLVADVNPGAESSDPLTLFGLGDKLHFFAKDGPNADSYKLWSTDGTQAGTALVKAVIPRAALFGGQPPCGTSVVTLGTHAYFNGYDSVFGSELWRTDGSATGTTRVTDSGGFSSTDLCWLVPYQSRVFFASSAFGMSGVELWSADGTGSAPTLIADINPGSLGSSPMETRVFNGTLYFVATDGTPGPQLWRSDGSSAGTRVVSNTGGSGASSLTLAGGKLVFLATGGSFVGQLWASDGTTAGTARVGSVTTLGPLYSDGTRAYFPAPGTAGGRISLWVTDGTDAGTHLLVDTNTPILTQIPFWDFNGVTIFQAQEGFGPTKLWRTDGTTAGTREIAITTATSAAAYPVTHQAAGQTFFYATDDGTTGVELFAIDNAAPFAADDAAGSVQAGQSLNITVLSNDSDADGQLDASTVSVSTQPGGGAVSVNSAGVITYTANASFAGPDQFTYSVADNQGARSQPGTVRVTVTAPPTNPPPTTPPPTTPPPSSSGGGGGGALGLFELLGFLMLVQRIKRRRAPFAM